MRIKIINGANLNMLGRREAIYGTKTLDELTQELALYAAERGAELEFFQSNFEGAIIDEIHSSACFDGLIINPGAYSHYSYAIMDALGCISIPKIEVHLTDIKAREAFRAISVTVPACDSMICGKGIAGYKQAIDTIIKGKQNLIFIGMMGSGKTTVARECARILNMDFCDTDEIFSDKYGDISTAFEKFGEQFFRSEESKILLYLSKKQNTAIACGGGAVLSDSFALLKSSGTTIYLKAEIETLHKRLKNDNSRPLNQGIEALKSILDKREQLYERHADLVVNTDSDTPIELAKKIAQQLSQ